MRKESISLMGFMGCGKTTLGKKLARKLNWEFVDVDAKIVEKLNMPITDIFTKYGEEEFRILENKMLKEFIDRSNVVISTGGGAPCFHDNLEMLKEHTLSLYIQLSPKALIQRLTQGETQKRPLLQGLNADEMLSFIESKLAERESYYLQADIILNQINNHPNEVIEIIKAYYDRHS